MNAPVLLKIVREWEDYFQRVYKRKPSMRDREQFFLGIIEGMRCITAKLGG